MAFPTIASSSHGADGTGVGDTNSVATLPSGIQSGDLLLGMFFHASGLNSYPSGWTVLKENLNWFGSAGDSVILWRRADGSEGSTIAFTNNENNELCYSIHRVTNGGDPSVAATWSLGSGATEANPPSLTMPSSGDHLWLTPWALVGTTTHTNITPPSGYTMVETGTIGVVMPYRTNAGITEDPGIFLAAPSLDDIATTVGILYVPSVQPAWGMLVCT